METRVQVKEKEREETTFTVTIPEAKDLPVKAQSLDEYLAKVERLMHEDKRKYRPSVYRATHGKHPREYLEDSTKRVAELLEEIAALEDRIKHAYALENTSGMGKAYVQARRFFKGRKAYEHLTMEEILLAQVAKMNELTTLLGEQTMVYASLREDLEAYSRSITKQMNAKRKEERDLLKVYDELKSVYAEGYEKLEKEDLSESDRLVLTSDLKALHRRLNQQKHAVQRVKTEFLLLARKREAVDTTIQMLDGIYNSVDMARMAAEDAADYLQHMSSVYDTTARMGDYATQVMNGLNKVNGVIEQLGKLNATRFQALMDATETYAQNPTYERVIDLARGPLMEAEKLGRAKASVTEEHLQEAIHRQEALLPHPDEL